MGLKPAVFFCFLVIVAFLALGCGGGSSSGGGSGVDLSPYYNKNVNYQLGPNGVTCVDQSDSHVFTSGSYTSKDCTWNCGNYKGQSRVYVSLTFRPGNPNWYLDNEYVSGGLCH